MSELRDLLPASSESRAAMSGSLPFLELAHRGFRKDESGDLLPERPFPWQLKSEGEPYEIQGDLEEKYAVRLVQKARDAKGRGKALDEWNLHPLGRCRSDKQDKENAPLWQSRTRLGFRA